MISSNSIIKEIKKKKLSLFETFFPKYKYGFQLKKIKKFQKFKTIIVIGMGGSILGSKAIYSFLRDKIKKKFIFIDNLDQNRLKKIQRDNDLRKILFLMISKSGNTTETIVNSSFFKKFLRQENTIVISEKRNNALHKFAKNKNIFFVEHDPNIGGRYSIFSEVGMLPVYLMDLKPDNFKKSIPNLIKNKKILTKNLKNIFKIYSKKKNILVLFNYVPELENFLFWCQQLLAESLGKNKKGFTPIVSSAPKDHHSLLQLYLDGPKDKFFYVFSLKNKKKLNINSKNFGKSVEFLNKKKYDDVKFYQKKAFIQTLKEKKIPFKEILIKRVDEDTLGKLFFHMVFEAIALSKMFKVNAFNQPAVERVKVLTKKFLI